MKASYPVILTPAGRGYVVFVPNLNINTEGGTLAEALDMARDAISIWGITEQDAGRTIPEASDTMPTAAGGQIVQRVDVDFEAYRRDATAYPACFYKENDGYSVIFPDLNYLATQGDSFEDAMQMAVECLASYLYTAQRDGDVIPAPSKLADVDPVAVSKELDPDMPVGEAIVNVVSVDVAEYAKKHFEKSVKKTLSIPAWLNDAAMAQGVNFSRVLQQALKEQLHLA